MATSKLIKPTNETVSIPDFTDRPDQRGNSNCIDKIIDGVNLLNDQIATKAKAPVRVYDIGRVATSTSLTYTGKHVTIPAGSFYCVRGYGIYTSSRCTGVAIGVDSDPTHTYNFVAAYLNNTQGVTCGGYALNQVDLYLHVQYASAANNDVGLDGFYIPS